jgi:sulfite reductase (NADPH) hemoprotein beta-component
MSVSIQVLTANRLDDGEVVFWSGDAWVKAFGDAHLFEGQGAGEQALSDAKGLTTVLIDPYLIDVTLNRGRPAPVSYRERIRALGPTDHLELGKQALGGEGVEAIQNAEGAARSTGRLSLIKRK